MKIIGVLLARANSKGLPRKHMLPLCGKPMIHYSFEAAKKASLLDHVVFSTNCPEMAELAKQYDIDVPFLRPDSLATDTAHTGDVVEHAVDFVEKRDGVKFDLVMTLQPTSPLRSAVHINEAITRYKESPCTSLMSVKENDYPPWWLFKDNNGKLEFAIPYKEGVNRFNMERQEFPAVYRPNGAIYIVTREYLQKAHSHADPDDLGFYVMKESDSANIDHELDFLVAEQYLKKKMNSSNVSPVGDDFLSAEDKN